MRKCPITVCKRNKGGRVLLVGKKNRGGLASALMEAGFEVVDVACGVEALAEPGEWPDIAILDEIDEGDDCYQVLRSVGIHFIVLGRDSRSEGWAKAVSLGADYYRQKPFGKLELVARVKTILRRYRRADREITRWLANATGDEDT